MIHTLLPNVEKKALRREYQIRAAIVLFFMLSVSLVIGLGALFPTIVKVFRDSQEEKRIAVFASNKDDDSAASKIESELNTFKTLLGVLSDTTKSQNLSNVVEVITGMRQSVALTSIAVMWQGTSTIGISLEGKAPTRDSLLSFKKRLEESGLQVELPISELAKSKDVKFSMNIIQEQR